MSLQMGFYAVGYFAELLDQLSQEKIQKNKRFIQDIAHSLEQAFAAEVQNKKYALSKHIMKKIGKS